MVEKDKKIEAQRTDITNLRKKNFEFRSKIQELKDESKEKTSSNRQSEAN